jgi:hypothetical protein
MAESCVLSPISAMAIMPKVEISGLPVSVVHFSSASQFSFDNNVKTPNATNNKPADILIKYGLINLNSVSPTSTPSAVTRVKASITL